MNMIGGMIGKSTLWGAWNNQGSGQQQSNDLQQRQQMSIQLCSRATLWVPRIHAHSRHASCSLDFFKQKTTKKLAPAKEKGKERKQEQDQGQKQEKEKGHEKNKVQEREHEKEKEAETQNKQNTPKPG